MYAYFIGKIAGIYPDRVVLENNGIGYNIFMPAGDIEQVGIGEEVKIFTFTSVREDAFILYGFLEQAELDFFKLLLGVNGIGPKAAINILGSTSIDNLQVAIIAQDSKTLSKVPGIGSKTAARIILDLKDKVTGEDILGLVNSSADKKTASPQSSVRNEALEALTALGYSSSEAMRAVNKIEITEDMSPDDLVRQALINI
jgi:Holliday junction DNA helicase RuvA